MALVECVSRHHPSAYQQVVAVCAPLVPSAVQMQRLLCWAASRQSTNALCVGFANAAAIHLSPLCG